MTATVGYAASKTRANNSCTATTRSARSILFASIQSRSRPFDQNLPDAIVTSALSPGAASTSSSSAMIRAIESKLKRFSVSPRLRTNSGPCRSRDAVPVILRAYRSPLLRLQLRDRVDGATLRAGARHRNGRWHTEVCAGSNPQGEEGCRPASAGRHRILEHRHLVRRNPDHGLGLKLVVQVGEVE